MPDIAFPLGLYLLGANFPPFSPAGCTHTSRQARQDSLIQARGSQTAWCGLFLRKVDATCLVPGGQLCWDLGPYPQCSGAC